MMATIVFVPHRGIQEAGIYNSLEHIKTMTKAEDVRVMDGLIHLDNPKMGMYDIKHIFSDYFYNHKSIWRRDKNECLSQM